MDTGLIQKVHLPTAILKGSIRKYGKTISYSASLGPQPFKQVS